MSSTDYQRRHRKGVDHISELPDSVLCLILSFLDTRSAVKTSVLSSRWNFVWTKVPTLYITDKPSSEGCSIKRRVSFKSFVNNVLLCNDVSNMQRLCFDLSADIDVLHVKSWLKAISGRKFRELDVKLGWPGYKFFRRFFLPSTFLCSATLVILKIEGYLKINSPASIHLPHLHTVHLMYLNFPDDEFMRRFSSGCPLLRELHIVRCSGLTTTLYIDSVTLESLQITNVFDQDRYDEIMPCISIKAPNLRYLALDDILTLYDIVDMILLTEAIIYLHHSYTVDDVYAHQIFSKVSAVITLQLGSETVRMESNLPVFSNLTCLKVEPDIVSYRLLKRAPTLKRLILESANGWEDWFRLNSAPAERLPYLESVEICEVVGDSNAFSMVEYFLKAAPVLKEIIINMNSLEGSKTSAYERLLIIPRSSPSCQVKIVRDSESEFPYFCTCY